MTTIQTSDEETKFLGERVYKIAGDMVAEGHKPFAIAAVFALVALQIYKTSLSEEDYNKMVDSISESRNRIRSLEDVATVSGSLH